MSAHTSSEPTLLIVLTTRLPVDLVLHQLLTELFVDDVEMEGHYRNPVRGNFLRMNANVSVNARRVS